MRNCVAAISRVCVVQTIDHSVIQNIFITKLTAETPTYDTKAKQGYMKQISISVIYSSDANYMNALNFDLSIQVFQIFYNQRKYRLTTTCNSESGYKHLHY